MKVLPIAYQKQWGVNYSINDKRRDFMSDNNKKVEEKAAEIIQATETQTVKPAAAEDKEFKKKKSTTWERNQRKWGWAFILPTMIGIIVLNLWPIVQTIYQSFCKVGSFGDSSFAGFANYKKMFADPEVWQSLLNTFKYAIIEVPFSIAIALILAVFLNRKMHGRTIYRAIFFLPMVVAPAAVAMVDLMDKEYYKLYNRIRNYTGSDDYVKDTFNEQVSDMVDEVGKVKSIKVEDRSEKEYDEDKLKDVNDTFDMLDVDMTVDKCYEVDLDVKIKGSTDESDGEIIYTVIKTGGKWYLVDYDLYVY